MPCFISNTVKPRPTCQRWIYRGVWVILCLTACAIFGPPFVANLRPDRHQIYDFFQEWASAQNALSGRPVYEKQETTMQLYLGWETQPGQFLLKRNGHPPTSVLLAIPLAWLNYPNAFLAWSLLSLAAFGMSLWLVIRGLAIPVSGWSVFPTIALLLVCNPFTQQMNQGQLNLILLLLLTGLWTAERSDRDVGTGMFLGTATAIKLFPAFLFLYFILRRRWQVVSWGLISVLAWSALTVLLLGGGVYESYLRDAMPEVAEYKDWWPNISLPGLWFKLFDGRSGHVIPIRHAPWLAQVGIVLSWLIVLFLLARVVLRARSQAECDRAFGLSLTAMVLLSPIAWDHYCLLLLLPVALLWLQLPAGRLRRRLFYACLLVLWLTPMVFWKPFLGATIDNWMTLRAMPWQTLVALSPQCYALIGLFALGLTLERTRKATSANNDRERAFAAARIEAPVLISDEA